MIIKFILKNPYFLWLILILLISIFFRTYQIIERLDFAHDSDLASWIIKDIVVNHHFRLIGQLTTAEGIFIGPLFYYLLIPFYLTTKMDPVGGVIFITLLGALTIISYYFVFSKLFNPKVGLIAAFFQAVLIQLVTFDRWVVPSTPTNLWSIWFFYVVIMLVRKRQSVLIILGALVGLIWHIHIALAPALLAVIPAMSLNFKFPKIKYILGFLVTFLIGSIPLILFETRHNFSQTLALISNFTTNHGGGSGLEKFNLLTIKMGSTADGLFFSPQSFFIDEKRILLGLFLLSALLLPKLKLINWKELAVLFTWILGVVIFFTLSSSPVSEYYFASTNVILIGFVSLWISYFYQKKKWGKYLVLCF
ncbi:MAG: glycosyltransferase family 39 protein, partial [Candidatus Daviesbacteria bacterium]|nr:glycosyltransferase family 39 protein [Candidatus Daviesbacteria bacterium]